MPAKRRRYCGPCDQWVSARHLVCPECGAVTDRADPFDERERDADDGLTYADPRDERDERHAALED